MNVVFLVLLLVLQVMDGYGQDPNFHIYLALGQSNMDGAGDIEQQDRVEVEARFKNLSTVQCNDRSLGQWRTANTPLGRCSAGLSPVDYFGRTMVQELPEHISVGVVVVAVAGSKIELFDKYNYKAYADTVPSWMKGYINEFGGNPYQRLVDMGKKAQESGVIKGILLHQGESNNGEREWLNKVQDVYTNLITDLQLDATQVPLLAGEMVSQAEGGACWWHNTVIADLPNVVTNAHVVSSEGLPHKGDGLHFTSESYRVFGKRYAEKMLRILDSEALEPVEPVPLFRDSVYNGGFETGSVGWTLNIWNGDHRGVSIKVYSVQGEGIYEVPTEEFSNESWGVLQNNAELSRGIYFVQVLDWQQTVLQSKMIVLGK
jgi:hypothetical protein